MSEQKITQETKDKWREAASSASKTLAKALNAMPEQGLVLESIAPGEAIGENSLDGDFLTRLDRGDHRRSNFLATK